VKRFVLVFDSGILVIKHWKVHNYIQNDRYHETQYLEEKKRLFIKENGSYTDNLQNGYSLDTQVRARLGKATNKLENEPRPVKPETLDKLRAQINNLKHKR
jgi:hypothetical protein